MAKAIKPKQNRLTTMPRKERLFEDYYRNTLSTLQRVQDLFQVDGAIEQVFGVDPSFAAPDVVESSKNKLKANRSWGLLSQLYDYAVEGIDRISADNSNSDGASSLVIDAGEIIAILTGEENWPSDEWHDIVRMGDGRYALEDGAALDVIRIALLANVDVRTVRNAISAGALVTIKHDDDVLVENASARLWLMTRKGFKPTVMAAGAPKEISLVRSPDEFAAFVRDRRAVMPSPSPLLDPYPGLTDAVLTDIEAGIFRAPLSLVWPLADFYGIGREELLECVMRVFFPAELEALSEPLRRNAALKAANNGDE